MERKLYVKIDQVMSNCCHKKIHSSEVKKDKNSENTSDTDLSQGEDQNFCSHKGM